MVNKNKRGWFRVFEASVACLLLLGVFLFVFNYNLGEENTSTLLQERMSEALDNLNLNSSLRNAILDNNTTTIETYLSEKLGTLFTYNLAICDLGNECTLPDTEENLIVVSRIYSAEIYDHTTYNPKELIIGVLED